jgi:uncharacterized protein (DUF1684 family)
VSRRHRPPPTAAADTVADADRSLTDRATQDYLDLADWRRRVGDLYRISGPDALTRFRRGRDELFRTHPQSPIPPEARAAFGGLAYFDPNPAYRFRCRLEATREGEPLDIDTGGEDGVIRYRHAGELRFKVDGKPCRLTVFSLVGYGGGLFLPFRDATSGKETYGGGRYLFDTVKNTDGLSLELKAGSLEIVIDFNYAYNPSCAYDARWACPLAPRENWLSVAISAGEKIYAGGTDG